MPIYSVVKSWTKLVVSQFKIKIKPRRHSDTKLHGDYLRVSL
jgi:hypothetical protein